MKCYANSAAIAVLAVLALLAMLTWVNFAASILFRSARALSCSEIKAAVQAHGEGAVREWAKSHGMTEQQIEALKRRCEIR